MDKRRSTFCIIAAIAILAFLAYIITINFSRHWTGSSYDPGYLANALIPSRSPDSSLLWSYVDFQSSNIGLNALIKTIVLVLGIDTPGSLYAINRVPFSLILWIVFAVIFYIWLGRMMFENHRKSDSGVMIIALVAAFVMPATATYHLTHFFFSNALYGWILLSMVTILAFDFHQKLGSERKLLAIVIIATTITMYHTGDQVVLIMVAAYSVVLFFSRYFAVNKQFQYKFEALFIVATMALAYLMYNFKALFNESVRWMMQTITSPLPFTAFLGRLSKGSSYISIPSGADLFTQLLSLVAYLALIIVLLTLTLKSKTVPFQAKLGVFMLVAFILTLSLILTLTIGLGMSYQRVFEYSIILQLCLFSVLLYSYHDFAQHRASAIILVLCLLVFFSTAINKDFLSDRENYLMEYRPSSAAALNFLNVNGNPPVFATLKTSLNYLMLGAENNAFVVFDPMIENNQDYLNVMRQVFYSANADANTLINYLKIYGFKEAELVVIINKSDYEMGWTGFNGFYKPITAQFDNSARFALIYDNGETRAYLVVVD